MELDRKIIHIDMDAFYASIEQRDDKKLKGRPVIVGGNPQSRGVVATCSYEARKYGIHSAMPSAVAYNRCPYAVFVRPRFDVYRSVSNQIQSIFYRYTDLVEPLSLDEAYLDVTKNKKGIESAIEIAKQIKVDILKEVGLTSSAGISYNKFLAKIASDFKKPNGLTIIDKGYAQEFLDKLPVNKFFGVGKVTSKTLKNLDINTGYDLRNLDLFELESIFKKRGYDLYLFARGIDDRPVEPNRVRKSVGAETTLSHNLDFDEEETRNILDELCEEVCHRLKNSEKIGKTLTLKVKYEDFTQITRSVSLEHYIEEYDDIRNSIDNLLRNVEMNGKQIRLLGVTISNLNNKREIYKDITLFEYMDSIER